MILEQFRMLDTLTALDVAAGTIAFRATLPETSPVFDGHFPGGPILPGVLMTEIIAQASALLHACRAEEPRMPLLMAIDRVRFRAFLYPGQTLDIAARITGDGVGYVAATGELRHAGTLACEADLRFRLMPDLGPYEPHLRFVARTLGLPIRFPEPVA